MAVEKDSLNAGTETRSNPFPDEHLKDQWNNWSNAMNRIKQDEQKWLRAAMIIYGGLITIFLGKIGVIFQKEAESTTQNYMFFNFILVVVLIIFSHLIAVVWTHQALVLRVQYYRTMARSRLTECKMSIPLPRNSPWLLTDFNLWRERATRPNESKLSEMKMIGGSIVATGIIGTIRFYVNSYPCLNLECEPITLSVILILLSLTGFLWPSFIYERRDKKKLKSHLFEDKYGPIHELREWIANNERVAE